LEIKLQSLHRLSEYKVNLEQYPTPPNIVSAILYSAEMENNDISNRTVCDLGCGDGIFAIGAALLGARYVVGVDVQSKALKEAQKNSIMLGTEDAIDFVLGDVSSRLLGGPVDTVVSNPPFGVKKKGADLVFLSQAMTIANVIYSIHLAGEKNRAFLATAIARLGGEISQIETFQFPIPKIYEFHRKRKHLTTVDLYRICRKESEVSG
jgi:putative methylase